MTALKIRVTHTNPMSGLRTLELSPQAEEATREWLLTRGITIEDVARRPRRNARGLFTIAGGVGYAVLDSDLLGGNADGTTERAFNRDTGHHFTY